jgi:hypothetical protein
MWFEHSVGVCFYSRHVHLSSLLILPWVHELLVRPRAWGIAVKPSLSLSTNFWIGHGSPNSSQFNACMHWRPIGEWARCDDGRDHRATFFAFGVQREKFCCQCTCRGHLLWTHFLLAVVIFSPTLLLPSDTSFFNLIMIRPCLSWMSLGRVCWMWREWEPLFFQGHVCKKAVRPRLINYSFSNAKKNVFLHPTSNEIDFLELFSHFFFNYGNSIPSMKCEACRFLSFSF